MAEPDLSPAVEARWSEWSGPPSRPRATAMARAVATADPDAVAAAVQSCPDVVRLSRSTPGTHIDGVCADVETATYLPGRRVDGVQVRPGRVVVRVVCRYGSAMADLAEQIRAAVNATAPGHPRIDVIIDDLEVIAVPGESLARYHTRRRWVSE